MPLTRPVAGKEFRKRNSFFDLPVQAALGRGFHKFRYLFPAFYGFMGTQAAGVDGAGGAGETSAVLQGHSRQDTACLLYTSRCV